MHLAQGHTNVHTHACSHVLKAQTNTLYLFVVVIMSSPTDRHEVVTVFHVDKDSQLVLFLTFLSREAGVGVERVERDPLLSGTKGKEDTSHWGNVHGTTNISYDVLMCIRWIEREKEKERERERERGGDYYK